MIFLSDVHLFADSVNETNGKVFGEMTQEERIAEAQYFYEHGAPNVFYEEEILPNTGNK